MISLSCTFVVYSADTCQCDTGFSGSDCGVDLSQPPNTASVQGGGQCDRKNKLCRRLRVTTDGCVTDVQCKITHSQVRHLYNQLV